MTRRKLIEKRRKALFALGGFVECATEGRSRVVTARLDRKMRREEREERFGDSFFAELWESA
jgi:hypothetical protein